MYGNEASLSRKWLLLIPMFFALLIAGWFVFSSSDGKSASESAVDDKVVAEKKAEADESFDARRMRVDNDPAFYESKAKENPTTAADHYLLGRAYVLLGMKTSAKTSFDRAFEVLSQEGIQTDRALAADIVFGRTVTSDDESFIRFRKSFIEMTAKDREERRAREEAEASRGL
jgi:hypothetical protein